MLLIYVKKDMCTGSASVFSSRSPVQERHQAHRKHHGVIRERVKCIHNRGLLRCRSDLRLSSIIQLGFCMVGQTASWKALSRSKAEKCDAKHASPEPHHLRRPCLNPRCPSPLRCQQLQRQLVQLRRLARLWWHGRLR
jgi:hypothetical protein